MASDAALMVGRKSLVRAFVLGAVVAIVVGGAVALALNLVAEWRTGWVELVTDGAPLEVQILAAEAETAVGKKIEVASRAELALADGEYRIRVNGKGRLGRTFRFVVNRGERQSYTISLDEGRLLGGEPPPAPFMEAAERPPSIAFEPVVAAVELSTGGAGFVERSNESLSYRDASTGKVLWDGRHSIMPRRAGSDPSSWLPALMPEKFHAKLLEPPIDLNGDGIGDLVWYFGQVPAMLALSGVNGEVIWNYVANADGPGGPRSSGLGLAKWYEGSRRSGEVAGQPVATDIDRDGTTDLIATIVISESDEEREKRLKARGDAGTENSESLKKRTVEAISGRTGQRLWSYSIDASPGVLPEHGDLVLPILVEGRGSKLIAVLDGTNWRDLDQSTGQPHGETINLGFVPVRPVQHGDLDGDGEAEILALGTGRTSGTQMLHAISVKLRRELWAVDVGTGDDWLGAGFGALWRELWDFRTAPRWPLVADLNADGRREIVVPDVGAMAPLAGYRGLRLIDGATGETRWIRPMYRETQARDGVVHVAEAPDFDRDGTRDVIVVSRSDGRQTTGTAGTQSSEPTRIYVDLLSGKDGRPFWCWHVNIPMGQSPWIWPPAWFGRGKDDWPMLAVPLGGSFMDRSLKLSRQSSFGNGVVHLLEASTGREAHTVLGLERAGFVDLNGDGLGDLWGEADGELRAFRGEAAEAWRALGYYVPAGINGTAVSISSRPEDRVPAGPPIDFNGDGVADVLLEELRAPGEPEAPGSFTALARSGRDGRVIWKTGIDPRGSWLEPNSRDGYNPRAFGLPSGDLDGDGTPDVLVRKRPVNRSVANPRVPTSVIELLSGRTGARIWSASPSLAGGGTAGTSIDDWLEPRIVERGGQPDVIVRSGDSNGIRLARISGRDGRIIWDVATSDAQDPIYRTRSMLRVFGELDGDGALDAIVVMPRATASGQEEDAIVAISLREGRQLWSREVRFRDEGLIAGEACIGDADGDGRNEVVVLETSGDESSAETSVRVLEGRDGGSRWEWKTGATPRSMALSRSMVLADLDGNSRRSVAVVSPSQSAARAIVILDETGKERARRDLPLDFDVSLDAVDLNGDGRDELVFLGRKSDGARIRVMDRDLKDIWIYPARSEDVAKPLFTVAVHDLQGSRSQGLERIVPGTSKRAGKVILEPGLAIDGASGKALWTGQASMRSFFSAPASLDPAFEPLVLDPGDDVKAPLLIANGMGATACRVAIRTEANGVIAEPRGKRVVAGGELDDPRWSRPLPWRGWLDGLIGWRSVGVSIGLAVVNFYLPVFILMLVARRRRVFRMTALLALPVVTVVPLMAYRAVSPWLPVWPGTLLGSEWRVYLAGTVAGVPIVYFLVENAFGLLRGRWQGVLALLGTTVVVTAAVAGAWAWVDRRRMALGLEHYEAKGWWIVVVVAAYLATVVWGVRKVLRGGYTWVRGLDRRGLNRG